MVQTTKAVSLTYTSAGQRPAEKNRATPCEKKIGQRPAEKIQGNALREKNRATPCEMK